MDASSPLIIMHLASGDLWAGAEVQLYTLANELRTNPDMSVCVVLLNHGVLEHQLVSTGLRVEVLDESKLNAFQILRKLVKLINTIKPDVVHTHRRKENIIGSIAAYLARRRPSLRTVHGAPEHNRSWRCAPMLISDFLDWFCGRFLQRRIIAVSHDLAEILGKSFPVWKIRVIENGIGLCEDNYNNHNFARRENDGVFRIGIACRLVPVKRVDIFIQTARYILDYYPEFETCFHVYGDGPMRASLERLSKELGTNNIVKFEGHTQDISDRIQRLDVMLLTSDHEGLPMILLEAMALGVPVIAHATGGIPDLLGHGACGILVKEQSAASYASEIIALAEKSIDVCRLIQNAKNRIKTSYSASRNSVAYISEYAALARYRGTSFARD